MEFLKDHYYKICFSLGGKIITFTCKIISEDEKFISFIDKFGKTLTYNKSLIMSVEEVLDGS